MRKGIELTRAIILQRVGPSTLLGHFAKPRRTIKRRAFSKTLYRGCLNLMRETYVLRDGELVPKASAPPMSGVFHVLSDIKPFVTQDGKEISSRSGLRAYEQANGVKQVGNDFATQTAELRAKVYGQR